MKWTHSRRTSSQVDSASGAQRVVAERCAAALWSKLPLNWVSMNPAELRGYVRARAAAAVREQLDVEPLADKVPLTTELIERTVHLVMRRQLVELQSPRIRRLAA